MSDVRRPHYFDHQRLELDDFVDEQEYHIEMRRRHNRYMHDWGIAEGLLVEKQAEHEILITPGMAIDRDGREVVLTKARIMPVAPLERAGHFYVVVDYEERAETERSFTDAVGHTRTAEVPVFSFVRHLPPEDSVALALARVHLDDAGRISGIDLSVRHDAKQRLTPGIVRTEFLADDSVTPAKLSPSLRRQYGWVRMSFKPHALHNKTPFRIGPTEARSEKQGSWGTMGVPSPPGAHWITGFRIAGEWNDDKTIVELFRCGWDAQNLRHERLSLFRETLLPGVYRDGPDRKINPFEWVFDLDHELNRGHHALSVVVECTAEASISLIAVRFEYDFRDYERRLLRLGR